MVLARCCNISSGLGRVLLAGARGYSELVSEHFYNPRNVGKMEKTDNVGEALVGKASCGDLIRLQIKVKPETEIIEDVKYKVFGCGSAIASSSYASEMIKGKTLNEAAAISNKQISEPLGLPPVKIHCSLLAEDAIKRAIADYRKSKMAMATG